ncbi:MAG: hypothetical protein WC359_13470 [Dehalococcoidia bacterium]|jgi:hypothetical protein
MKYDKEHINPLIESLENGEGRVNACKRANISYRCFLDWMDEKHQFSQQVKKAEAKGNDRIKDMQKRKIIEDKSWQSGAWWLERNHPDEFRLRTEQHNTQPVNLILYKEDENL